MELGDAYDSDNADDDAYHAKGNFEDKNNINDTYDDDHRDNYNHHGDDRGHHKYDDVQFITVVMMMTTTMTMVVVVVMVRITRVMTIMMTSI